MGQTGLKLSKHNFEKLVDRSQEPQPNVAKRSSNSVGSVSLNRRKPGTGSKDTKTAVVTTMKQGKYIDEKQ